MKHVIYFFKSLFSNTIIIEERKRPWYWALIFFLLSLTIFVSPVMSKGFMDAGTSFIQPSSENGLTTGLVMLSQDEKFQNMSISHTKSDGTVDAAGHLNWDEDFYEATTLKGHASSDIKSMYEPAGYTYTVSSYPALIVYSVRNELAVDFSNEKERTSFLNNYIPVNTSSAIRSFICFSDKSYLIAITSLNSSTSTSTSKSYSMFVGTYHNLKEGFEFKELAVSSISLATNSEFLQKWSPFITDSYTYLRNQTVWINVGISLGAFTGAILICGLLIWLFTLSKKNILHGDCSLWEGFKMSATLSLTCAIIGALLTLMNSTYGLVFGIMAILMRTIWLIMKTNGSGFGGSTNQKPMYKAR